MSPTYQRFEDLPVWRTSIDLAHHIYGLTEHRAFTGPGDLASQLRRAALSVSNNIAEGFERGTTSELLMFLYIARGSAGEVRSMLRFCEGTRRFSDLKSQISNLIGLAESCSRQIRGWAEQLQDSDIPGQRKLTKASRARYEKARRAEAFMKKIDRIVAKARNKQAADGDEGGAGNEM
jgi:four helix bundle protein